MYITYPHEYVKDRFILGVTWIGGCGVVVVKNEIGSIRAYMKAIPEGIIRPMDENPELSDAIHVANYGNSITLKAAEELGVFYDEN